MEKLLVKKTGEILSIVSESQIKNFKFEFEFDKSNESSTFSDEDDNEYQNSLFTHRTGKYFKCSNKKSAPNGALFFIRKVQNGFDFWGCLIRLNCFLLRLPYPSIRRYKIALPCWRLPQVTFYK